MLCFIEFSLRQKSYPERRQSRNTGLGCGEASDLSLYFQRALQEKEEGEEKMQYKILCVNHPLTPSPYGKRSNEKSFHVA